MTVTQSLLAYMVAAGLLTITPGLDTAIVLRVAALEGPRKGAVTALGIALGLAIWGVASAVGLTALLAASQAAYTALKWIGAAYLVWLGVGLLLSPGDGVVVAEIGKREAGDWFRRGLLTNLLNPKIGVFYITFLPQFVPVGVAPTAFVFGLVAIHIVMGLVWFAALILAVRPLGATLRKRGVIRAMNRLTGAVFVGFGVKLALPSAV